MPKPVRLAAPAALAALAAPAALAALAALVAARPLDAQRRFRIGPTVSSISLEDISGTSHAFTSFGGAVALITGDDGETAVSVARYNDLSTDNRVRRLTLFGLDSYYYPVGTGGVAPFAETELGLARVTETGAACLIGFCTPDTVSTASEFAIAFGLGVRANVGANAAVLLGGRFLQVPGSQIQGLEAVADAALAFGSPRKPEFLEGTLGPTASVLIPISGPLRGRAPFAGVRFRRDTRKSGTVGLEIDFAPLEVTGPCSSGCEPNAILFAPGYEPSVRPAWGRLYGELGLLLAGVYTQGPDRGMAQGAHAGVGADLVSGRAMWNINARLLWLQRNDGENVFGVQLGLGLAPAVRGSGAAGH